MKPTKGRIINYRLSGDDVKEIDVKRRVTNQHGNPVSAGDTVPAIITAVFENEFGPEVYGLNLKLFLDGEDTHWVTSRKEGSETGEWSWPARQ